ncbi:TonB C-terminal domain-containing protein [Hyphomonas sp. WL0036]|uniref:TonB family protein n=1 Tax=Hyphomonas sediminis TaxID=2866160 RepID=UPI001C80DC29|nr:TonB C-terminal domain-containing protein [Hyphomonas sediminis]
MSELDRPARTAKLHPAVETAAADPPALERVDAADEMSLVPSDEAAEVPESEMASPSAAAWREAGSPTVSPGTDGAGGNTLDDGGALDAGEMREVELDAYFRAVRLQLDPFAPRRVSGARDCRVAFALTQQGEVVFVRLEGSSGQKLFDRRCLKAVTAAAPFPDAPVNAQPEDLLFAITMKNRG